MPKWRNFAKSGHTVFNTQHYKVSLKTQKLNGFVFFIVKNASKADQQMHSGQSGWSGIQGNRKFDQSASDV